MDNRNYIIERLKSKSISINEFNFDKLQAPPLSALLTPMDISQLNYIAKSIRYSGKPHIKYQEIDKVMRRRGFVKLCAGTNRVIYRFMEDNSFVVKVAADAVGLGDNPKEFKNQFTFKPFVTKCFEISPCGTVGIFEKVNPITSREEFISVASDIYEVINKWFIGEYILEDIGTKYFMNWGIRPGFGPVLLDFPYVYKLDGNKLYCNAPNYINPSHKCEGVIDYDSGYNFLYCTKCGVIYKAKELEEAVKDNNVIIKSEGGFRMKVLVKKGKEEKVVYTGEYADNAKAMPAKPVRTGGLSVKVTKSKPVEDEVVEEVKSEEIEEVKEEKKEVVSPITFDESLKKKTVNGADYSEEKKEEKSKIELFNSYLEKALEIFESADEDEQEELTNSIIKAFKDQIKEAVNDNSEEKDEAASVNDFMNKYTITFNPGKVVKYVDDDFEGLLVNVSPVILNADEEIIFEDSSITVDIGVNVEDSVNILKELGFSINRVSNSMKAPKYCAAKVVNVADIFDNEKPSKVIAIIDEFGNYLTVDDGDMIAIDVIDDRSTDALSLVSTEWLNSLLDRIPKDNSDEENEEETDEEEEASEKKEIPTGVLAPAYSVNGVPVVEEEEE